MRTKSLLLALGAAAALAGCASFKYFVDSHEGCDDPSNPSHMCRVTITASACDKNSITAVPNSRHIPANGAWVIQWTLASPGYEFADDGIEFRDNPGGIFTKRGKAGAATFVWVDRNVQKGGPYKYNVHLLQNGKDCGIFDPDVYND